MPDIMPLIGINVMSTGTTIQTVRNEDGSSVLEFGIEEYLGQFESRNFTLEVTHKVNNRYLYFFLISIYNLNKSIIFI